MVWNFRNLEVWKVSFGMVRKVYSVIEKFPTEEKYALASQMRRAVVSISSNIAEGCGRRTSKDFVSFLHNALGSTKEVESQVLVTLELGYITESESDDLIGELSRVGAMLLGLIDHVLRKGIK
jgi:four helix bundle protein